jgi:hypothetical protein
MSEELHAAAYIAALNTNLAGSATAYDYDEIPATLPNRYVEVTVSRRYGGEMRGEKPTTNLFRATTRVVAKSVSDARELRRRVSLIEGTYLTVGGVNTTPIQFETDEPIGPDDGYYSGLTQWTWAT